MGKTLPTSIVTGMWMGMIFYFGSGIWVMPSNELMRRAGDDLIFNLAVQKKGL
jgi:hypothetical protein